MKFLALPIILIPLFLAGQPSPQERYPERIKAITEKLKTDPLNYELIWDRLQMKVNLLGGFDPIDELFTQKADTTHFFVLRRKELYFNECITDFNTIYENIILVKKYDVAEEGDFYLNRIWFYYNMGEINKAIADAIYLRDRASYSRYSDRGDYYNDWALYALFNLSVINNQFKEALDAIDTMLKKKKRKDPTVYYSGGGSFLDHTAKVRLFEHFNATNKIIPYIKECCFEHFNWYFNHAKKNDYYRSAAKQQGFELLKLLTTYMKTYGDGELPKYEAIYQQLRYQQNESYETINPSIPDSELKAIVAALN